MLDKSTISFFDLAYAAAIIDGEGSIFLGEFAPKVRHGERTPRFVLTVACGMTIPQIPYWLSTTFGGSVNVTHKKQKPQWKGTYLWRITGKHAAAFLHSIRPFLKLKMAQADLGMYFAQHCIQDTTKRRYRLAAEQVQQRHTLVMQMRELNKRGNPIDVDYIECVPKQKRLYVVGPVPSGDIAPRTHCKKGHLLEGDNVKIHPNTGYRQCRQCDREYKHQIYLKRKARFAAGEIS